MPRGVLLSFLCSLTVLGLVTAASKVPHPPRVAVCISGQVGRMIPEYFVDGLLKANPSFHFHLFFNLAVSPVLYTTFNVIQDTKYQNMSTNDISLDLQGLFGNIPNTEIANITYDRLFTRTEWTTMTGLHKFNVFEQFKKSGYIMLNMYKHQEDCGNQIVQLETQQNFKMDYVINTREDIFFFKPLDLNSLIAKHMTARSSNSSGVAEDDTQALQTVTPEPPCDLITKGCLDFGGLNMRLQVIRRDPRGAALMAKVSYFKQMLQRPKRTFENPEMFEQYIAEKLLHMKVCKLAVEELPVTAARLSYVNLSVCFIHQELKLLKPLKSPPCVPKSEMDFAIMHLCPRVKTRYEFIPWQSFPFVPNSAFPDATKSYHRKFQGDIHNKKTLLQQPASLSGAI